MFLGWVSTMCGEKNKACVHHGAFAHDKISDGIEQVGQDVWDHGDKQHKLCEFMRPPCALEVATAIEDGQAGYDEAEEILLDDGCQRKDPGIPGHRAARDYGQPRDAVADADNGLLDLFDPIGVWAQGEVEQGAEDEGGKYAAREGREVDSGHGAGGTVRWWREMRRAATGGRAQPGRAGDGMG